MLTTPWGCGDEERPQYYSPSTHAGAGAGGAEDEPASDAVAKAGRSGGGSASPQGGSGGEAGVAGEGGAGDDPEAGGDAAGNASPPPQGCDDGPELHVLFIGNSHTFVNDLPSLVRELACRQGTKLVTGQAAVGGYRLIDHAMESATLAAIASDAWDVVFLQDQQQYGTFRLGQIERDTIPALTTLVEAIETNRADTRIIYDMVWARRDGDTQNCAIDPALCTFEGATTCQAQGYRFYAERAGGVVSPVALAWRAVGEDPDSPLALAALFDTDGNHPALPGSYLAAAVLVGTLFGDSTVDFSYDAGLDAKVARYLRSVADGVVNDEADDPRVYTKEKLGLYCAFGAACSEAADAKQTVFSISTASCDELLAGTGKVLGRVDTTVECRGSACETVRLGDFHRVVGGALSDGTYQARVLIDIDDSGDVSSGDLLGCKDAGFTIGDDPGLGDAISTLSLVP